MLASAPALAQGSRLPLLLGASPRRRQPPPQPEVQPLPKEITQAQGQQRGQFLRSRERRRMTTGCTLDSEAGVAVIVAAAVNCFTNNLSSKHLRYSQSKILMFLD